MASSRPVICALTDGVVSRHAVRAGAWLARSLGAELVLAHAFDPLGIATRPQEEMLRLNITDEDLVRMARHEARRLLDAAAQTVTGVALATELMDGQPADQLERLAAERRAALLVAGTAARAGLDRIRLGSVSSQLAASSPCPLVAVPRGAVLEQPGPIVAGYDGSAHSRRAALHAAGLSARLGRDLLLLHVTGGESVEPSVELARELHAARVSGLRKDAGEPALDPVRIAVEEGEPAQVLAGVAREREAALLVTGTRGRNALSSMLLGSVSAELVRTAGRPVALVPASAG